MTEDVRWQVVIELPEGSTAVVAQEIAAKVTTSLETFSPLQAVARKCRIGKMLVSDIVRWATQHQAEHGSTHGINCSCVDRLIQRVRKETTVEGYRVSSAHASEAILGAQLRVDWVMTRATSWRY